MKQQHGFAHAVLIIGLVVALTGALGFIFWQNFIHEEPVKTELVKVEKGASEEVAEEPAYTLQDAIDDIEKVVSSEGCNGSGATDESLGFAEVDDNGDFTGKNVVNKSLTHAYAAYGCGSQGVVALLKKDADSWTLLNEDARVYPMCDVVRGEDFPASVVDKCYENDSSTEPTKI